MIVALVILEVSVLGAVAAGQYALRLQLQSALRQQASSAVAMVADSLFGADSVVAGQGMYGGIHVRWAVTDFRLGITATHRSGRADSVRVDLPWR